MLSAASAEVFEEFLPLPGSPNAANLARYKQIAGKPTFDEHTGSRDDSSAVFVVTEGIYFCLYVGGEQRGCRPLWRPRRKLCIDYYPVSHQFMASRISRSSLDGENETQIHRVHAYSLAVDFDVLVGGHLTRLGTKEDVQNKVDFFADMLTGAEPGMATVSTADIAMGTGVFDPTNANVGNSWLLLNEYQDRVVDVCYNYVMDSNARGRDWAAELAGLELTLRSHCWMMQEFVSWG